MDINEILTLRLDLLEERMTGRFNKIDGQLNVIRGEQTRIRSDFDKLTGDKGPIADHETRIRSTERWKAALPITILVGLLAAVAKMAGVY